MPGLLRKEPQFRRRAWPRSMPDSSAPNSCAVISRRASPESMSGSLPKRNGSTSSGQRDVAGNVSDHWTGQARFLRLGRPAETIQGDLVEVGNALSRQANERFTAKAHWLAAVLVSGDTLTKS
jgi:hypothetical protein